MWFPLFCGCCATLLLPPQKIQHLYYLLNINLKKKMNRDNNVYSRALEREGCYVPLINTNSNKLLFRERERERGREGEIEGERERG